MTESWKPSLEDETVESHTVYEVDAEKYMDTEPLTDESILERLRKHYQTEIDNVNQDTMVEGPFEDGTKNGELWEKAASRIDARGGLRVHFTFADQEGGC